jgi:hypothetical protein
MYLHQRVALFTGVLVALFKEFDNFYKFTTTGARGVLWILRPSVGKTNRHEENMWLLGHVS